MGFERSIGNWELAQLVIAHVDLDRLEVESPRVLRREGSKCQHGASRLPGGCRFEVRVARHVRRLQGCSFRERRREWFLRCYSGSIASGENVGAVTESRCVFIRL